MFILQYIFCQGVRKRRQHKLVMTSEGVSVYITEARQSGSAAGLVFVFLGCIVICRFYELPLSECGSGSSVSIATDYGLDGPGIESQWGRDFPFLQTCPRAHPSSCTMGTGSFPGVKCGRGVLLTTHPLLAPRSWKSRAIPLPASGPQPGL